MEKFDKDHPSFCAACGSKATFTFHENRPGGSQCLNVTGAIQRVPHMHRYCPTCQRQWVEEPAA
jgi:thymidine kinase